MNKAILGLGSNLGKRTENITNAANAIGRLPGTTVIASSSLYETKPVDVPNEQNDYLNECIVIMTELSPRALLGGCLGIEAAMGRERRIRHDSRTIDIDLLIYEGATSSDPELILPHPELLKRAFVLVPISEIFSNGAAFGVQFSKELSLLDTAGINLFIN
jgi:2-amino-4-hydroxy-6-hydroxymethyldihydropteridine diphosphokinase